MRWSAYAATLTARQFTRVVNLLTTGYGYAYLAARAAEKDGQASLVLSRLELSQRHLSEALSIMGPETRFGLRAQASGGSASGAASQLWHVFLAQGSRSVAQAAGLLADAVVDARRAADTVQQDGELEHIRQRLDAALAGIVRLLELTGLLLLLV